MPQSSQQFHHLTIPEVCKKLKTSPLGLTEIEAAKRREKYGLNLVPQKKRRGAFAIFAHQFQNALILILIAAFVISATLGKYGDAAVIAVAILVNAIFGFLQEHKAESAFETLRNALVYTVKARRDGTMKTINAELIVPGDIVRLTPGDRVSGDGRLIKSNNLFINESSVTGESEPVCKMHHTLALLTSRIDQTNCVRSGTVVTEGNGEFVVTSIGSLSYIGKIAKAIEQSDEEPSLLAKKLERFSRMLGGVILAFAFVIFIIGLWAGKSFEEMLLTSVAVAVAAIPEGLAITVTAILAIGMQRILREKALVRRLSAAETLGSTSIICVDKTGTLTEGIMEVERIETANGHTGVSGSQVEEKSKELVKALEIGVLCNDAYEETDAHLNERVVSGTPVDQALYKAALQSGIDILQLHSKYPRLYEVPFSSGVKSMITLHKYDGREKFELFVKGAPEKLLRDIKQIYHNGVIKPIVRGEKDAIAERITALSKNGFRVLLAGFREVGAKDRARPLLELLEEGITFVCLYGLRDPLRFDVKDTLAKAKEAGIRVLMLTGDHKLTAQCIGIELGLIGKNEAVVEGDIFTKSDDRAREIILNTASVFARVAPEDKLALVSALRKRGWVVAMTGDGVNDAPALAEADIGIALGSGTDTAKESADMVLLDNNFSVIISAIREGRIIFNNIRTVILYFLADSFSAIILLVLSFIFKLPLPLTAAQLLWINIITDGLPSFALTLEPADKTILNKKPIGSQASLVTFQMKLFIALISSIGGIMTAGLFYFFYAREGLEIARTVAFTTLAFNTLAYVYSIRDLGHPFQIRKLFSNSWLILAVGVSFALQMLALYAPPLARFLHVQELGSLEWAMIIAEVTVVLLVVEFMKLLYSLFAKTLTKKKFDDIVAPLNKGGRVA